MKNTPQRYFESLRDHLRDRVRDERQHQGLRQTDLAERAGVTEKWISRLETRGENVSLKNLAAIALALGVEVGDLLPTSATGAESTAVRQAKRYIDDASPKTVKLIVRLLRAVQQWQARD